MVGVINKKGNISTNKILGSIINYTLTGGDINVKILLDMTKS